MGRRAGLPPPAGGKKRAPSTWTASDPHGGHQVCFGGKHNALASWGRAELWDGDTGVMVGSIATNGFRWQQACTGGLYGQHYYLKGTDGYFCGEVWN
ncbi:hypothetical protein [Streptomyces sp. NPDC085665]|uniref:hypothetical protein n=1 Tax=Streptomyces sp. NPDC085665 TaxID=3365735 RepID=UPI0037D982B3